MYDIMSRRFERACRGRERAESFTRKTEVQELQVVFGEHIPREPDAAGLLLFGRGAYTYILCCQGSYTMYLNNTQYDIMFPCILLYFLT